MEGTDDIRFEVNILDPSLLSETLIYNNTTTLFSSLKDHQFDYKFVGDKTPFLRMVALHAVKTLEKAQLFGWEEAGDFPALQQRALELARLSLDPVKLNI